MQYSFRHCDANQWLYTNNDLIIRSKRYESLKEKYNSIIGKYLNIRSDGKKDFINNANKNMCFLEALFRARGYEDLDIKEFLSRDVDSLELIGMKYEDLLLKLAIVNRVSTDVECLINFPKVFSRYSAQDLYTAVRIIEKKYTSNLSSSDLALLLYLRDRERYDSDEKLTSVRKFMFSRSYYEQIISLLCSKKLESGTGEELVLKQS